MEIFQRAEVRNEVAVKAPFFQLLLKEGACAGALAVDTVICAHDALDLCILHKCAERRQVGVFHIMCACFCIKGMSGCFRAAVYCKMLCTGRCPEMLLVVALQALYKSLAELGRQERILTVGFLTSAPPRIAENIDIR